MKKYKIIISEPWDFEYAHTNIIEGIILAQISSTLLLFKANYSLTFGEISGDMFILKPRYEKQAFNLKNNDPQTVGGALLQVEHYNGEKEDFLEKNSAYVFIGSLIKLN